MSRYQATGQQPRILGRLSTRPFFSIVASRRLPKGTGARWFVCLPLCACPAHLRIQNALFNSALRQSTSIRKDLDQFADSAAPSPHLQAQLSASLTSFSRAIDEYGKLAKQEPVQTKQEKAFERLKNFRSELEEYRENFKRIKSANEDVVCICPVGVNRMAKRGL